MGNKSSKTPIRILMLGLDSAGKTSTLYHLKKINPSNIIPTVGYNVETIKFENQKLNIWDIGGQTNIRPLWRRYFLGTEMLLFVVDCCDVDRLEEAKKILHKVLEANELRKLPLLVFANKQDLQYAVKPTELTEALALNRLNDRDWYVQPSCATTGDGLEEGLKWLMTKFQQRNK